jgi:phage terminase large subunit-like protein
MTRRAAPAWWGRGPAPHERWPGVTIAIDDARGRYVFDRAAAAHAVAFASECLGYTWLPWVKDLIVRPVFGWKRARDRRRRFQRIFLAVPKQSGKSTTCIAIAATMAYQYAPPGTTVVVVGAAKHQAENTLEPLKRMIRDSAILRPRTEVYARTIVIPERDVRLVVLASDAQGAHGYRISALVYEELHAADSRDLYDALSRSVAAQPEPLILLPTTAGDDPESLCAEEWTFAEKVRDGVIPDETLLPVLFSARDDEAWDDPATYQRVNPSLDLTVQRDYLEREVQAAQAEPRKRASFARYHLNRWAAAVGAWIPLPQWEACAGTLPPAEELAQLPCVGGLDLSSKIDLSALCLVWWRPSTRPAEEVTVSGTTEAAPHTASTRTAILDMELFVRSWFWIPEATARQREQEDLVPYRLWAEQGWITLTSGDIVDYEAIHRTITERMLPGGQLRDLGYDPFSGTMLSTALRGAGVPTVEVSQSYRQLSEPSQYLEALVRARRLTHDGSPVLRWHVSNCGVKEGAYGDILPTKLGARKRIDGVTALVIALNRWIRTPAESPVSAYADHSLLIV